MQTDTGDNLQHITNANESGDITEDDLADDDDDDEELGHDGRGDTLLDSCDMLPMGVMAVIDPAPFVISPCLPS
jgi:hypothetical protein